MKKRIISLLIAVMLVLSLVPDASAAQLSIDIETTIAPQYEDAKTFSEGYAAVMQDGKWGYIDEDGNVVVDFLYDWAGIYSEGVAITATRDTLSYDDRGEWTEEVFVIHMIDMEGNDQILYEENMDDWMGVPQGYPHCPVKIYLDETTGLPYPETLSEMESSWFAINGVANVSGTIFDLSGKQILFTDYDKLPEPESWQQDYSYYDYVQASGPCVNGVIPMYAGVMGLADGMQPAFLMDTNGKLVKTFEPAADWGEGTGIFKVYAPDESLILAGQLAGAVPDEWGVCYTRYGVMDMNGNWVIQPEYTNFYIRLNGDIFGQGLLPMQDEQDKWGVYDTRGNVVIPFDYDWISIFSEGYASAMKDGACLYLDAQGNEYGIAGLDGAPAAISICSNFNSDGIAAVWNAETGEAYCISSTPVNGMLQAVAGSERIDAQVYFPGYTGEGIPDYIYPPADLIVIEEDGLYGFAKVTVKGRNPFVDVTAGDYFLNPVIWAVDEGITAGTSKDTFSPNDDCTRAQVVTFLWRAAGKPEPKTTTNPFSDVKESDWFYKAVLWAVENEITVGIGGGKFGTEDTCTRAQVATFLWRTAGCPDHSVAENPFTDLVEEWYVAPVLWAYENNITKGDGHAWTFNPEGFCSRAQIVTFLHRFYN